LGLNYKKQNPTNQGGVLFLTVANLFQIDRRLGFQGDNGSKTDFKKNINQFAQ
jgi:hypothetical protein